MPSITAARPPQRRGHNRPATRLGFLVTAPARRRPVAPRRRPGLAFRPVTPCRDTRGRPAIPGRPPLPGVVTPPCRPGPLAGDAGTPLRRPTLPRPRPRKVRRRVVTLDAIEVDPTTVVADAVPVEGPTVRDVSAYSLQGLLLARPLPADTKRPALPKGRPPSHTLYAARPACPRPVAVNKARLRPGRRLPTAGPCPVAPVPP